MKEVKDVKKVKIDSKKLFGFSKKTTRSISDQSN